MKTEFTNSDIWFLVAIFSISFFTLLSYFLFRKKENEVECKHDDGWQSEVNGATIDIEQELVDVTEVDFSQLTCKKCKKSLAEINF